MNLLFVHNRPSGGAGQSLFELVKSIEQNHNPVLLFMDEGFLKQKFDNAKNQIPQYYHPSNGSWILNRDFGYSYINYLRLFLSLPGKLSFINKIRKIVKKHKIDFIYSNSIYFIEGAIAAKLLGLPHIWQVRELIDLNYYKYCIPKKDLVSILNYFSHYIICNSQRTASSVSNYSNDNKKLKVVYNIVNYQSHKKNIRDRLNLSMDTKIVAVLGWITPIKRIEDFIDAANLFTDEMHKFLIIGGFGGDKKYNELIKEKLKNSPNLANIILTGIIPNASDYLESIDLLLSTCFAESFGRSVAEALIAGVPCIGIIGSAVEELIQDKKSGYVVNQGDYKALASLSKKILSDNDLKIEMGAHGKNYLENNFSPEKIGPLYEKIFSKI